METGELQSGAADEGVVTTTADEVRREGRAGRREGTGVSTNETLAGYSNLLLYSSMAVYAGAFAAYDGQLFCHTSFTAR